MSGMRLIRLLAVATAALVLASCRSLTAPLALPAAAVTVLPDDVVARPVAHGDSPLAPLLMAGEAPATIAPVAAPLRSAGTPAAHAAPRRHEGVVPAGLETPCPPLPRLAGGIRGQAPCGRGPCGPAGCGPRTVVLAPGCRAGCPGPTASCGHAVPIVAPCLVCDGGDHGAPARPVGQAGLGNLTAGDTVARYRPADEGPDGDVVRIAEANCACVYAPRFGAVREVVRPLEDAAPLGPGGIVNEQLVGLEVERQPVWGSVQNVAPGAARKALPGVAVQERLGPLAVDQGELPRERDGFAGPNEGRAIERLDLARRRERPFVEIGFDVPVAWTCIKAANVVVDGRAAEVVAADRGTATLRFEEPGRAELTLCKRSGTDTARVGEEIDFTIYLLNSGDRPLAGIVLADALPERLSFVPESAASSLPAGFSTETGDDGSVVLTWSFERTIQPGESGFVRFRAIVR